MKTEDRCHRNCIGITPGWFMLAMFIIFMVGSFMGVVVGETGGSVTNVPGPWEYLFTDGYVPHDHNVESMK